MPVSPHFPGAYNINFTGCWLLLLLCPVLTSDDLRNCSFIEGQTMEYLCNGLYDRHLRLRYKDRHPAPETPYAIWQRADHFGSLMLLIIFYETQLSHCYNLILDNAKFYCDGRNFPLEVKGSPQVNCVPFQFTYIDELNKRCRTRFKPTLREASTIYSAIIYMDSNVLHDSRSFKSLHCSNFLFIFTFILLLRCHYIWKIRNNMEKFSKLVKNK